MPNPFSFSANRRRFLCAGLSLLASGAAFAPSRAHGGVVEGIPLPQPGDGNTYVINIGINDYSKVTAQMNGVRLPDLQFCVNDAQSLTAAFSKYSLSRKPTKQVIELTDAQATRAGIVAAFDAVAKAAKPQDVFVFTFSGYMDKATDEAGRNSNGLIVADTTTDPHTQLSPQMLSALLARVPASRQLLLLDSCSGEGGLQTFLAALQGSEDARAERALAGRSVTVVCPSLSIEDATTKHGILTGFVVEELARQKPSATPSHYSPKPPYYSVGKLVAYLRYRFADMTDNTTDYRMHDAKLFVIEDKPDAKTPPTRGATGNAAPPLPATKKGKDYALLVGCSEYDDKRGFRRLPNPVNDVANIAKALRESYRYVEVQTVLNPTYQELMTALRAQGKREYADNDQLFLYFAGHGDFDKTLNEGFLVCKDSISGAELGAARTLQYSNLRAMADNIPCKHVFVVLDACFSGAFDVALAQAADRAPGDKDADAIANPAAYIAAKMPRRSRKMLTSGRLLSVSDGKAGQGSPFARRFEDVLRDRADRGAMLTFTGLTNALERSDPEPHFGNFGRHDPGSDFLFVP